MGLRKCLKQLITREVTSMHAIHISHFNALFDSFSGNVPSNECLYFDNRLNVAFEHLLHFIVGKNAMGILVLSIFETIGKLLKVLVLYGDSLWSVSICALCRQFITLIDFELLITFIL